MIKVEMIETVRLYKKVLANVKELNAQGEEYLAELASQPLDVLYTIIRNANALDMLEESPVIDGKVTVITLDSIIYQISRVIYYYIDMKPVFRYLYEEISKDTDEVVYSHYISKDTVKRLYPTAV